MASGDGRVNSEFYRVIFGMYLMGSRDCVFGSHGRFGTYIIMTKIAYSLSIQNLRARDAQLSFRLVVQLSCISTVRIIDILMMFGVVHTVSLLCPKTDDSDQEISEFAGYTPFIHDFIMNEGKNGIEHWYKTLV
jgi:hypothetical protein